MTWEVFARTLSCRPGFCEQGEPATNPDQEKLFLGRAEMNFPSLFSPLQVGPYRLQHRVAMAPLTRMRAERSSFAPRALNAEYYGQRATPGGLIIVEAVHAKGGVIFLQLWHVGRVSHSSFQPGGALPVAPSAVPIVGNGMMAMTADGKGVPYETPRALETGEVKGIVEAFRQAAHNALKAGFDGVEIHGANGYLLEQFLQSHTNLRTDRYGGASENPARVLMEITQAAIEVWGANRVGVRLSPYGVANGSGEADPIPLYGHVIEA